MYTIFEKLMKERDVTRYRVSKETGISQTFFKDWEDGKYQPKIDKYEKLANYFNVSVEFLRGEAQKNKPATISDDELSEDEIKFLRNIRQLPPDRRELVEALAISLRNTK